jgi:DNA-directed RNA polymerase specialized sigma24 family protein
MESDGSVTRWLGPLQAGDPAAAQQLWERYFRRLVQLARKRLHGAPRRAADEEDVALDAFDSLRRGAEEGRFPWLLDRDNLWRLLVVITARKAAHLVRDQNRRPRADAVALDQVVGREPTPEFAAEVAEEFARLLRALGDTELEAVARWRMEGYSVEEIATRLGYAPRSVKRKLRLIRRLWAQEGGS